MADSEAAKAEQKQKQKQQQKNKQKQQKQKKDKKDKKPKKAPAKLENEPEYIAHRLAIFDKLYAKQQEELAAKTPEKIKITLLPSNKEIEGESWRTTPQSVAEETNPGGHHAIIVCKVDGVLHDMDRLLEADCTLQFLGWDDPEAKEVFWHSSSHVLGQALELCTGANLAYGPPIDDGFYYDMSMKDGTVNPEMFANFEEIMKAAVKQKQPFQRLTISKADLLEMFKFNKFKQRILNERVKTDSTTVYRNGPLIDLCRGPHIRSTSKIKALKVTKNSSTYWEGNADAEVLQRVYAITFPDKKMLKEWEAIQAAAAERDHRKVGREQELFFFHELSPGSCFFLPKGAHIYNTLVDFIKTAYRVRGFKEVVTPNIFNSELWKTSGHWQHYAENMFSFDAEDVTFALKPMNCPGHCLMFKHLPHTYKELPIRYADFGVLHRNELAGALTGLTRVRRFQQDDAHIFCREDQIEDEIAGCLDFLQFVYAKFGFTFELNLSTRPKKAIGSVEVWDRAEAALKTALTKFCGDDWKLNPEDGAFYGPKIDITIKDALTRAHQLATIQLDFNLPDRFDLSYVPSQSTETAPRPVIIHRAILGSVERCIAILTESCGGKWPLWLSPEQARVVPAIPKSNEYAESIRQKLFEAGFQATSDVSPSTQFKKKVRDAQISQVNFILVVGPGEETNKTVNVRTRHGDQLGEFSLDAVIAHMHKLVEAKPVLDDDMPLVAAASGDAEPGATAKTVAI